MSAAGTVIQDVIQVCRNGHVVTDLLRTNPESALAHCDLCGAGTIERCGTCGKELPGALTGPLRPLGLRQPPLYCCNCGVAFPWTERANPAPAPVPLARLEELLTRLPEVIRQLRTRHGDRPPFRVTDIRDLEDLVRALLPILFDDIRPECRTPAYATTTRTDFVLARERIALTLKIAQAESPGAELVRQLEEDIDYYYRRQETCRTLVCFVYDPEGLLRHFTGPHIDRRDGEYLLEVRWVVAAP